MKGSLRNQEKGAREKDRLKAEGKATILNFKLMKRKKGEGKGFEVCQHTKIADD